MVTIEVNGRTVDAQDGETILAAAADGPASRIPTLCHIEGLPPSGACRMCVVEVEGQRGLVPSCAYPVAEGMKVRTHSPRAVDARKTIVELLLANHPDDCLYCVAQRRLPAAAAGASSSACGGGGTSAGGRARASSTSPARRSCATRPSASCAASACGCARRSRAVGAIDFIGRGSRAHVGTAFDEGLNVSQLHQLRAVRRWSARPGRWREQSRTRGGAAPR